MGHSVTAIYKQAEAQYAIANLQDRYVATLQYYAGRPHNRPPRRFIVFGSGNGLHTLADDICRTQALQKYAGTDPLFPEKTHRTVLVDNLV